MRTDPPDPIAFSLTWPLIKPCDLDISLTPSVLTDLFSVLTDPSLFSLIPSLFSAIPSRLLYYSSHPCSTLKDSPKHKALGLSLTARCELSFLRSRLDVNR